MGLGKIRTSAENIILFKVQRLHNLATGPGTLIVWFEMILYFHLKNKTAYFSILYKKFPFQRIKFIPKLKGYSPGLEPNELIHEYLMIT